MNRRYNRIHILVVFLLVLVGCSTEQIKQSEAQSPQKETTIASQLASDTLTSEEMRTAEFSPEIMLEDTTSEVAVIQLLERAREHYSLAIEHQESGDSSRSSDEFEYAIAVLNELAYFPGIDSNQEFTDLSLSLIEDYEKYISNIDVVSPNSSIFALREKLNQLADEVENPDEDIQTAVITSTTIPLVINGHVEQYLDYFQTRARQHFEKWLWRAGKYFPMMKKIFKEEGVPEELIYLSMVESGVNPIARSWAKAVGVWQFVKGTGKLYGLKGNSWYDERRDFEKATHAAAKHLKDLYNDFNDWYLALAAYNSGAGRVTRAMKKSKSNDFWKMRPNLPRETRNYVPQYIAATIISLNPKAFNFDVPQAEELAYDVVSINGSIDMTTLAQCAEADATDLKELNPELLKWCTPPGLTEYTLRIPAGKAGVFMQNYQNIPEEHKRPWHIHKVKRGETLARIGKRYGISAGMIADANKISLKKRLSVGQELVVPVPAMKNLASISHPDEVEAKRAVQSPKKKGTKPSITAGKSRLVYRIRKGDTLGRIAQLFDVRASDLRMWNDLAYGGTIHANETLSVWVPTNKLDTYALLDVAPEQEHQALVAEKSKSPDKKSREDWATHRVQSGDNLGSIAAKYGVSVKDIKQWNGLRTNKIMAGERLEIYTPDNKPHVTNNLAGNSSKANEVKKYIVRKGDTLHSIAALFGVSIKDLQDWNNLRGSQIFVGQELRIYA